FFPHAATYSPLLLPRLSLPFLAATHSVNALLPHLSPTPAMDPAPFPAPPPCSLSPHPHLTFARSHDGIRLCAARAPPALRSSMGTWMGRGRGGDGLCYRAALPSTSQLGAPPSTLVLRCSWLSIVKHKGGGEITRDKLLVKDGIDHMLILHDFFFDLSLWLVIRETRSIIFSK
uniref:Uncharacterized protein n=1 Tax=Aegilops tauschii subsp. strangulata TaxID=200361 RepID=A0A453NBY3_AEGTS